MRISHTIERLMTSLFPIWLTKYVGVVYGFIIPSNKSFSQYGEDLIISNFFKKIGVKNGTYLDIGAFHPRWLSNTHLLAKNGWSGTVVDIDQHKTKLFKFFREGCIPVTGAVASLSSPVEIKAYFFRRFFSEIDTLSEAEAIKTKLRTGIKYDERIVNTYSINSILDKTIESFGKIDFINIDIEGIDEIILSEIDFSRFKITAICFENNECFGGSPKIQDLLKNHNYIHLFTSMGSHCYCLKNSVLKSPS